MSEKGKCEVYECGNDYVCCECGKSADIQVDTSRCMKMYRIHGEEGGDRFIYTHYDEIDDGDTEECFCLKCAEENGYYHEDSWE